MLVYTIPTARAWIKESARNTILCPMLQRLGSQQMATRCICVGQVMLLRSVDNRWVVLHNRILLSLFHALISVEICSTVQATKYLYKYVYKGHDMAEIGVEVVDKIEQYVNHRYVSPCEALWRLYKFKMSTTSVTVVRLDLHDEDQQRVVLTPGTAPPDPRTKLTEYFELNKTDPDKDILDAGFKVRGEKARTISTKTAHRWMEKIDCKRAWHKKSKF